MGKETSEFYEDLDYIERERRTIFEMQRQTAWKLL